MRLDADVSDQNLATSISNANLIIGTDYALGRINWPEIKLVGIINADIDLGRPDWRAAENFFQMLMNIQDKLTSNSTIIIQTYNPEQHVLASFVNSDYEKFYREEIALRKTLHYPPFAKIVKLVYTHHERNRALGEAIHIQRRLKKRLDARELIHVSRPYEPEIKKQQEKYIFQLIVKLDIKFEPEKLKDLVPDGWIIDLDPKSLI